MTDELIAYRCWILGVHKTADPALADEIPGGKLQVPYAIVLKSLNGVPWPGPVMHADVAPVKYRNYNGIYTFKSEREARFYLLRPGVTGEIYLYGKIVEHALGYRAEHAALKRLKIHPYDIPELEAPSKLDRARKLGALVEMLERRYQCEVIVDLSQEGMSPWEKFRRQLDTGSFRADDLIKLIESWVV